ncbi:MAG: hypothetical protein IPG24_25225 [Leptospiraceae bacterium]|nr:hypothetical protein [Leptospiraceae bacterium]
MRLMVRLRSPTADFIYCGRFELVKRISKRSFEMDYTLELKEEKGNLIVFGVKKKS